MVPKDHESALSKLSGSTAIAPAARNSGLLQKKSVEPFPGGGHDYLK
jgi:hypothetical protein